MQTFKIAIDGPSGAGKSTVAKAVASQLGMIYVDTGALYRAIGLYAYQKGIGVQRAEEVVPLLPDIDISVDYKDGEMRVILNGNDVSFDIRRSEISMYASAVSAIPAVREFLLGLQRGFAEKFNVIMDGRDIGTVIMPDAQLKIFLTASLSSRAHRRYTELAEKGIPKSLDEVTRDMEARDNNDRNRKAAPAIPAKDAIIVDNSDMSIEENVAFIVKLAEQRGF